MNKTFEQLKTMLEVAEKNWLGMTETERVNSIRFVVVELSDSVFYDVVSKEENLEIMSGINKLMLKLTEIR